MASTSNLDIARTLGLAAMLLAACGGSETPSNPDAAVTADAAMPDGPTPCVPGAAAPTYSELYTKYFATGTPGHCANAGCHATDVNGWACGADKATCYAGMVKAGLINTTFPTASRLASPTLSPLRWISPSGIMPFGAANEFPEGRDAILAWIMACAENN